MTAAMAAQLCIASYNTKNLFNSRHPDHPKRPRELRELARMIGKINAQILALQEVENMLALTELNQRLEQPYAYCELIEGNSSRGIHLALMSNLPFELTSHRHLKLKNQAGQELYEFPTAQVGAAAPPAALQFQRDLLLAQCSYGEHTLAVFNMHLKSRIQNDQSDLDSDEIRLAEARTVFEIVSTYEKQHPLHSIIVLGDLNQPAGHASLQPIMALGYFDPILTELVPDNTQLSTHWSKPRDRIDHVLLSTSARRRYVEQSVTVHREAGARKASDHYPVSIRLQF
jgi:endonuclease/exonuclease/phosphatase family metal-dependent hydrolase